MAEENIGNVNSSAESNVLPDPASPEQSTVIEGDGVKNQKGISSNSIRNKGIVYPIIRINDHYCIADEIKEFYIESGYFKNYRDYQQFGFPITGFVPQMRLILKTSSPDLLKQNQVKSGDKCAIFFHSGGGMVKSYRADYIIKSVMTTDKPTERTDIPVTYIITGELYVPNLTNEENKFNFNGSSRDAMYDCAERLGLSFFFCDPDDTQDYQGWVCSKNLKEYALEVTSHAWKEFNAFYESWIDPRYGLSFININKMLVEDGLDEMIDVTPFVNTMNNSFGIDGNKVKKPDEDERSSTHPQAKILTNIPTDDDAATPFYIKKWNLNNRAAEISLAIGLNQHEVMQIDNPGVETQNTNVEMNYSIPINQTKVNNGFFVLTGGGVNITYTSAEDVDPAQSFVANNNSVQAGTIMETMSDGDAEQMKQTGGNMYSSGNTNKFYDAGWQHNMLNNLQLQKQVLEVELNGCNLAIMRGEKIPVLILDNDRVQALARSGNFTSSIIQNCLYEIACGWYIIDGIMWYWGVDENSNGSTLWKTKLKLVRREWPVPGCLPVVGDANTVTQKIDIPVENNDSTSTSNSPATEDDRTIVGSDAKSQISVNEEEKVDNSEVPLTGLTPKTAEVFRSLKDLCPDIKLVSARRWAVDEEGKRIEGNAFVKNANGKYKCVNAKGQIMYFSDNNSRHLYGQAFDIINTNGMDFDAIMRDYVLQDNILLMQMALAGMCAFIEESRDDTGVVSKHYHFGTEKERMDAFWKSAKTVNQNMDSATKNAINNVQSYNNKVWAATPEIKHDDTNE